MRRRKGGTGEEGGGLPSAPSPLTQIVPNSASIYSVFHSVNYNSVDSVMSSVSLYTVQCTLYIEAIQRKGEVL